MTDSSNAAEMLRLLRKKRGFTAVELAEKMGVSPTYIAQIELGEIQPTKEQMETLAAFIEGKL